MSRDALMAFCFLLASAAFALAEDKPESWVGQQVMARRPDVKFTDRNSDGSERVVKMSDAAPKVLRESDGRLRVWSAGTEAWVEKKDMVLLRDAPAHFTDFLRENDKSAWGWQARAIAWRRRGELDSAIKDFTEAIRTNPNNASAFGNRGTVWEDKKEYEKAIKDYDEAIRLDPKYALAFFSRGNLGVGSARRSLRGAAAQQPMHPSAPFAMRAC